MLKKIRESKNMSQSELAKQTGLSTQLIQLYEQEPSRINNAKLISLIKIAEVLECKLVDLIENKKLCSDLEKLL